MFELNDEIQLNEQQSSNEVFFTAGDDGVEQRNFFPGVYRQLVVDRGSIETNYILIRKPTLNNQTNWLMFEDNFLLPDNYSLKISDDGLLTSDGIWVGDLVVLNDKGLEEFRILKPKINDYNSSNDEEISSPLIGYKILYQNNHWKMQLYVSVEWLNEKQRDYPVTIDPTVSASGNYISTLYEGSGYANGTWNNNSCGYTITVNFPAGAEPTNASFGAQYSEGNGCNDSCNAEDGGFDLLGPCGVSQEGPGLPWTCQNVNWQVPCYGTSIAASVLVDCLVPSCQITSIPITLRLKRLVCPSGGCSNTCIRLDPNSYMVTIYGITVQSSVTSSSGSFNICSGFPVTYTAHPQYGVAPYSFVWNPGGVTGSPVTFNPTVNSTYTLITTDACGNTVQSQTLAFILPSSTATFTTQSPICITQTASFTYTGNGVAATTYLWNFNDPGSGAANTSTLQNPTHVFSVPGFYTVTLVATLGTCVSAPYAVVVFASPQPTSSFTISSPVCMNQPVTVTYTGNASAIAGYNWSFGGATIISGSGQGPYDIQWSNSGNHTITLQVIVGLCTSPVFSQVVQGLHEQKQFVCHLYKTPG